MTNWLKKIPGWTIAGACVGIAGILIDEFVCRVINPKLTIVDTYKDADGGEFYRGRSHELTTRNRINDPAKFSITIERRH